MDGPPAPAQSPAFLPLGATVGPWRVVAWAGQGVFGAVYRAVRVGQEHAGPVALKVALLPRDPRFAREAALLARADHPSIPRLLDAGEWKHPCGTLHPYLVMQWVDGLPLYDWARELQPSSLQVLHVLAQLARALEALHAQGALHRDFKGDNVRVRRSDGHAFLIDFGSGIYPGAAPLTPQLLPPGTPAYRSPEASLFELRFYRERSARYLAQPADDLYALGVTACRLVAGEYPAFGEPWKDEHDTWQLDAVVLPPALLRDTGVVPALRTAILRLLSVRPQERGTARELAQALEHATHLTPTPGPAKPQPEEPSRAQRAGTTGRVPLFGQRTHSRTLWLGAAAALLALVLAREVSAPGQHQAGPASHAAAAAPAQPDAGTVDLGDSAATTSMEDASKLPAPEVMAEDSLPEPQPGQLRPDAKGRCPRKRQVALNGGCWKESSFDHEDCAEFGGQMFKGTCYLPWPEPKRRPTSSPGDTP